MAGKPKGNKNMSQYRFDAHTANGNKVEVLVGWDRVLAYFFMVIDADRDPPLYSNLYEPDFASLTIEYFQSVLDRFGIEDVSLKPGTNARIYEQLMKGSGQVR